MIKFELKPKDYAAFNSYFLKHHSPSVLKYMRYFYILMLIILLNNVRDIIFTKAYWQNPDGYTFLPFLVIAGFLVIIFKRTNFITARVVSQFANKNPQIFCYQEITLADDKLIVEREGSKFEYNYNSFLGLGEDENYYFVFDSTKTGIVIPKEAILVGVDEEMLKRKIKPYK